ncbi:hypothetical protein [Streptomyces atriruber]|uniref:hypothetical protein n=1 Tax=Streptomyces atriruber TaxID=545121 RepID=UPI0006E2B360|nr:hypothetical protein [Streptomyces atriruber]
MPTYTFEKVELYGEKRVKCTVCGKAMKRRTTVYQTLNPFNKTDDGKVKSRSQILAELRVKLDAWRGQAETHAKCEGGAS